ncbi:DUF1993 domain-containing protein [Massilia sp. erpn]|uniref:DUF1993 domain-containing protein n=1 Tax=Massilia sp. erpn TaxID=2738142 RepID=UPI002108047D|nr:DUF1993 domain-containing protein [Massilia sp. erpn]UTY59244.1 DUF1993 domain-containing protein [Massilia sp. erpn]
MDERQANSPPDQGAALTLHAASVPVFLHYLERLDALVALAERHEAGRMPGASLLHAALAEGMFAFAQQVQIAAGFAVRACCPLLEIEPPQLAGGDGSWHQLHERIGAVRAFLAAIDVERMNAGARRELNTVAGRAAPSFNGADFVLRYALPNFFFHLAMAYAILRKEGLPVGKQDFDGYHAYPAGFSFL